MVDKSLIRYPVTYVQEPAEQALSLGDGDSVFNDIQLASTNQCLSLNVTSEQYMLLFSSALNGAQRHFPENWMEIIYPLIEAGKNYCGGTMTCEDVADCIDTDATVQTAIQNYNDQKGQIDPDYLSNEGAASTTIINNRFAPAQRATEIKEPPIDCDLDEIWSGIKFMVDKLDERGKDWLEQIVAKVDKWERAAEFVGTVPIVGEIGENLLKSVIDVIPDILEFYNAWSSEEHRQDMACTLFELVCAECRYPTFDEVLDAYVSPLGSEWQDWAALSLNAVMDYLFGSSLLASQGAWHTVQSFQLYIMYTQSTFFGLRGTKWLNIWLDNGEEFANDEWEILCDGCANAVWCYEWDFTANDGGFVGIDWFGTGGGNYVNGVGWQAADYTTAGFLYRRISIRTPVFTAIASNVTEWTIELDYQFGHLNVGGVACDNNTDMLTMRNSNQGTIYSYKCATAQQPSFSGTNLTKTQDGLKSQTGTFFGFQIYTSNDNQAPVTASGSATVRKIRLKGTGTMPAFTGGQSC